MASGSTGHEDEGRRACRSTPPRRRVDGSHRWYEHGEEGACPEHHEAAK